MSVDSEFHRSDAATGKERRPTVVSRNGGTSSCSDDEVSTGPNYVARAIAHTSHACEPTFVLEQILSGVSSGHETNLDGVSFRRVGVFLARVSAAAAHRRAASKPCLFDDGEHVAVNAVPDIPPLNAAIVCSPRLLKVKIKGAIPDTGVYAG